MFFKWLIGLVTLWALLAAMVEVDATRDFAVAIAWAIAGGMLLAKGVPALTALQESLKNG